MGVVHIDDGAVLVVIRARYASLVLSGRARPVMALEKIVEFCAVGMAGAQPTRATTIAAAAEPCSTASRTDCPSARPLTKPPMKLSPAPVGFSASVR
jgi:hypothetical protein